MFSFSDFKHDVSDSSLKMGDVIGVNRGFYDHYCIYTGREVVHFSGEPGLMEILKLKPTTSTWIRRNSLGEFKNGANSVFIIDFERYCRMKNTSFHIYSPGETVVRAVRQIGKSGYDAVFHNCEHFAIWCKTGRKISTQVLFGLLSREDNNTTF